MATNPKEGKLLYHMTALENLESIIQHGLSPRNEIKNEFKNVADDRILKKRKEFDLEYYVPFHFFSLTPFAGAVQRDYRGTEFVYLTLHRNKAKEKGFKIIPSHPLNYTGKPLKWKEGINVINWELMNKREYIDNDCCQCCMAESIYKGKINVSQFQFIFVRNIEIKEIVVNLLKKYGLKTTVVCNEFFFKK